MPPRLPPLPCRRPGGGAGQQGRPEGRAAGGEPGREPEVRRERGGGGGRPQARLRARDRWERGGGAVPASGAVALRRAGGGAGWALLSEARAGARRDGRSGAGGHAC